MILRFALVSTLLLNLVSARWTEKEFDLFERKLTELADQFLPFEEVLPVEEDSSNSSYSGNLLIFGVKKVRSFNLLPCLNIDKKTAGRLRQNTKFLTF